VSAEGPRDEPDTAASEARADPPPKQAAPAPRRRSFSARRALALLGGLVQLVIWLIVLLLVLYLVFTLGKANPGNPWAVFVDGWAPKFNLGLANLFKGIQFALLINYGIAVIVWLIIGSVLKRLLRRF
jgi:uncharacterized membrane protein